MAKRFIGIVILTVIALFVVFILNNRISSLTPPSNVSITPIVKTTGDQQQPQTITINYLSDGSFVPQTYQVKEGQQVQLTVASDVADEVHFHGYDLHGDVTTDKPVTIAFDATQTGHFDIELESKSIPLGAIEVYPN